MLRNSFRTKRAKGNAKRHTDGLEAAEHVESQEMIPKN
jgi:hypothetical protein